MNRTGRTALTPLITPRVLVALAVFLVASALFFALLSLSGPGAAGEGPSGGGLGGDAAAGQGFAANPSAAGLGAPRVPRDRTLRLTVPKLARVEGVPVKTGPPSDEGALRDGALHVEGTGFPWQSGANTYVAGHRLGFPGTRSNLLFWDLGKLAKGDRVLLEDAWGRVYEYAVFRKLVVGPNEVRVTRPVPGKTVVSLQTCTLPDYAERLVVQAELVAGPGEPGSA